MPTAGQQFTVLTAANVVDHGLMLGGAAASMFDLLVGSSSVILQAVNPGPSGDFNHDGSVDAADYVVWRKNPLGNYTPDDYDDWHTNFATAPGSGIPPDFSPPVPEPTCCLLAFLCACFGVCMKRRPPSRGRCGR